MDDLYGVLKTSPRADADAIQVSYRRLAFQYHPDRNPEQRVWAEEQMKRLNAAYYVLSHPRRRQMYDSTQYQYHSHRAYTAPMPTAPVRRGPAAYPLEIESDWHNLHVYAAGRTLPDEEAAVERRMMEYMREFVRLAQPPGTGRSALADLLLSAATNQFTIYSPYARIVAKVILRTALTALRARGQERAVTGPVLRQIVNDVNTAVQERMSAERLRVAERDKNIVADWSGMLLTVVDFLWGEG